MRRRIVYVVLVIIIGLNCSGCFMTAPFSSRPRPADFHILETGRLSPLKLEPSRVYGMGLTYASHINETASGFDPDTPPPVFRKDVSALNASGAPVKVPDRRALVDRAERLESGLGERIDGGFEDLPPLLDYEGELAFVLLEDVDWGRIGDAGYAPKLGYFIANDISARTIAVLGEGRDNRYDYWGASKSFDGFLPVGATMWVPDSHEPDSILNETIMTKVNGVVRQKQSTTDMIYTPRQMLLFISERYPSELPERGDVVLTGTPGGVALQVPAWKSRLADMLGLDRFVKLLSLIDTAKKNKRFLKPGDVVEVSGGVLGDIRTEIIE